MKLHDIAERYSNDVGTHEIIYYAFQQQMEQDPQLMLHRRFVEQNGMGYGDRAFHWMWKLLVAEMPVDFSFLEIGVFKGQVISLVDMMAKSGTPAKNPNIVGVTPLSSAGDKYCPTHPGSDFLADINHMFDQFCPSRNFSIVKGLSNDPDVIRQVAEMDQFDMVYIDGCHDYDVVVSDLMQYRERVKTGGYLIVDDCSSNLRMPSGLFLGLPDVTKAVEYVMEQELHPRFKHLFACGHNRIWQKLPQPGGN